MELKKMVELNEKKNKKRRLFAWFILLLLLLGGIFSASQVLQIENQTASGELWLDSEEIMVNPGEDQVAAYESMAVTVSGGAGASEVISQPENNPLGAAPLAVSDFDQFAFMPSLLTESNEQGENGEAAKPEEPAVTETDEDENEESSENGSEESEDTAEENSEEPQPEEPVYERNVYNFGDSEQFNLTRNVSQEEFDTEFIVKQGSWKIDEDGSGLSLEKGGEGRIFVPNNYPNYFVTVVAALNESTLNSEGQPRNDGGYAVMFETKLDSNNNDAGFALQFDRGYGNGEIVIRNREIKPNSKELPQTYENSPLFRYKDLPNKNDDAEWWAKEHQLDLQVSVLEGENEKGHNKNLSVFLDDQHLFDFTFESELEEIDENHVGLRVWHESSVNVDLIGLEIGELPATVTEEPALPETSAASSVEVEASPEPDAVTETE
jgi:hypothetical protein